MLHSYSEWPFPSLGFTVTLPQEVHVYSIHTDKDPFPHSLNALPLIVRRELLDKNNFLHLSDLRASFLNHGMNH